MSDRGIGDNKSPDMTVTVTETMNDLSSWMSDHPVISTEEEARESKVFVDRGKLAIKDLEDERESRVKPLNVQVQQINDHYRTPRNLLQKVLDELQNRLSSFLRQEEQKRIAAAQEAARKAEEAERLAREAERIEQEAIEAAKVGELDIDIAGVTGAADRAYKEYEKASHQAAIAERDTRVRIGGGFARALGLKNKDGLTILDVHAAIDAVGLTETIIEAVLKSARAYKRLYQKYPPGIQVTTQRKV